MEEKVLEIYSKEFSKLLNFIKSRINPIEDAEDILQDVFLKALVNINSLQSVDNLIAWLYRVAKNRIIDTYRKKSRNNIPLSEIDRENFITKILINPKKDIENDEMIRLVIEAIDQLPEDQKYIFIEHEIEGRSYKEISEDIGVSINTLLSRKRYAVRALRKKLNKHFNS